MISVSLTGAFNKQNFGTICTIEVFIGTPLLYKTGIHAFFFIETPEVCSSVSPVYAQLLL